MNDTSRFIVDADWLQKNIGKEGVSIIDGSWYLPAANRDAKKEYEQSHIPGAVFLITMLSAIRKVVCHTLYQIQISFRSR